MLVRFSPAQPKKIIARFFAPTFSVFNGRYGIARPLGGLVRKFSLPGGRVKHILSA